MRQALLLAQEDRGMESKDTEGGLGRRSICLYPNCNGSVVCFVKTCSPATQMAVPGCEVKIILKGKENSCTHITKAVDLLFKVNFKII